MSKRLERGTFAFPAGDEKVMRLRPEAFAMLTDGIAVNDLRVVIGGLTGVLLVSGDAGETFKLTQQEDRRGFSALLPGPAGAVIVTGEGGVRTIQIGSGS